MTEYKIDHNYDSKTKIKAKKDIKWYSYVTSELDAKLKQFMQDFKMNNQAKIIRNFVSNNVDYIHAIHRKKPLRDLKKYDEDYFNKYILKAIEIFEEGNGFHEGLKQKLSPLKLSILMLENHINEPDILKKIAYTLQDAFEDLENHVKHHCEKPKLTRFIKTIDVLYIDDNDLERKTLENFLQVSGLDINAVKNSDEGLYLLNLLTPQLILMDFNLKTCNINGDCLCQIIKSRKEYKTIPIILISTSNSDEEKQDILARTNADDIISKPVNSLSDLNVIFDYIKN